MSRIPVIGITSGTSDEHPQRYETPSDYATAIERAGGLPVLLPYRAAALIPGYLNLLDGLLFTGGDDLDPELYGQTYHPKASPVDPARQQFELALLAEAERRRTPMLGICLGSQLMNVYRGGSLIQFLPEHQRNDPLEHRSLMDNTRRHSVRIEPGTLLASTVGKSEIAVNTRHKQAVDRLGKGLRVNAVAPDGTIEGTEDPTLPLFLSVQWHPENLHADPDHLALFKLLVSRAGEAK